MTWVRFDDATGEHRKTRRLLHGDGGLGAFGLHALAILHSSRYLTDGFVEAEFVEETCALAGVRSRDRDRLTTALESGGQWERVEGGWCIHDYLDHNPSRAEVEAKRQRDAERKARGRGQQSTGSPRGQRADSARSPLEGVRAESDGPVPSRPIPIAPQPPASGGRQRDRVRYEGELAEFVAEHFPGVAPGYIDHFAHQLRDRNVAPTVEALRPMVEDFTAGRAA